MGWTEKLPNGRYRACWRDQDNKKRSRSGFTHKPEALRYAGDQESEARGGGVSYQGRSLTWSDWNTIWQKTRTIEKSSAGAEKPRISKWVEPRWGSVPLAKIKRADVQAWVNSLTDEMAPASVVKVYHVLSRSLSDAVIDGKLKASPCVKIELPTSGAPAERFLTRTEVDLILTKIAEPYRTAVIILAGTGLRFNELAGLHWSRVDLENELLWVAETYTPVGGLKPYPKTKKPRPVPVPDWAMEAMVARMPDPIPESCGLAHPRGSKCTSGLVLPGVHGGALNIGFFRSKHWYPALGHAGVEHATPHDLRHTTASWLLQGGATLSEVAAVLGHSSIVVTQRYAHLAPSHGDKVRNILQNRPAA